MTSFSCNKKVSGCTCVFHNSARFSRKSCFFVVPVTGGSINFITWCVLGLKLDVQSGSFNCGCFVILHQEENGAATTDKSPPPCRLNMSDPAVLYPGRLPIAVYDETRTPKVERDLSRGIGVFFSPQASRVCPLTMSAVLSLRRQRLP